MIRKLCTLALSVAVFATGTLFFAACGDDNGEIPPPIPVKAI